MTPILRVEVLGKIVSDGHAVNVIPVEVFFTGECFRIGSTKGAAGNDLCLNDPTVSRHHASVRVEQGQWHIRDEHSDNGVWKVDLDNRTSERIRELKLEKPTSIALGRVLLRLSPVVGPSPNASQ